MVSIWKIISNLALVVVFIILSVFSLVEYRGDNINQNPDEDKLPLAKITFTNISYFVSFLEKMPMIRLLPAVTKGTDYEKQMLSLIDNKSESLINNTNIKEENEIFASFTSPDQSPKPNLKDLPKRLKERLMKDWSRP